MKPYLNEIWDAVSFLLKGYLVYLIYFTSKFFSEKATAPKWKVYLQGVAIVLAISVYSGYTKGTHQERDDEEPIFPESTTVIDYKATDVQKISQGVFMFTLLVIPTIIGVHYGMKENEG